MLPNRIALYVLFIAGLAGAIAPVAANLDWQSTAGVITGVGAIAGAVVTFVLGWQKHEERTDLAAFDASQAGAAQTPDVPPDA